MEHTEAKKKGKTTPNSLQSDVINIYVRTNLRTKENKKIPNGKMAAQCAHAFMASFLSLFEKKGNKLVLIKGNKPVLDIYTKGDGGIKIHPLKTDKEFDEIKKNEVNGNVIIIEDQGRTSFSEPTVTTLVVLPVGYIYNHHIDCRAQDNSLPATKQSFVLHKELIKDKWEMFSVVAKCSIVFLTELLTESDEIHLKRESLKNWLNSGFAKIVLKPNVKNFDPIIKTHAQAISDNIYNSAVFSQGETLCVSFGPDVTDVVDKYTRTGLSLA